MFLGCFGKLCQWCEQVNDCHVCNATIYKVILLSCLGLDLCDDHFAHWQDYSAWYGTGYKMLCLPLLLVCSTDWVIIVVECSKVNVVNDIGSVCWFSECLSAREC